MSDAKTITTDMVREAMRAFCAGGRQVSNAQLFEVMELTQAQEKDRLRTRVTDMVAAGEVFRVARGLYEYNFKHRSRKNTSFPRIWRFIRTQKPGWSFAMVSKLTQISYTQVMRYGRWLEDEQYIVRHGKDGTTQLYKATARASAAPETPFPPTTDRNPFERERAAAARLATLMLCHDPYSPRVAQEIVKHCCTLTERFGNTDTQHENGGQDK